MQHPMTKDTLTLISAVRRAHSQVLTAKNIVRGTAVQGLSADILLDEAYDAYDALVDALVESSDGNATAVNTDPLTFSDLEHKDVNMTYNEMAEVLGQAAFGE
tara:strand:+ start:101 stop:409 length:309 start_codon:yes stop_codon:yes gene_type:complete